MSIAEVIGWKFNHQPGMRCDEVDGVLQITDFPGGIPSQALQDQWTAEYNTYLLEQKVKSTNEALKLQGVEFEGVMCSATAEDMWGLASIKSFIEAGNSTNFHFDNGSILRLTPQNIAAFEAVWVPFRQSFFQ